MQQYDVKNTIMHPAAVELGMVTKDTDAHSRK